MKQFKSIKAVVTDIVARNSKVSILTGEITKEKPLEIDVFEEAMKLYKTDIIVPKQKVKINGSKSEIEWDLEKNDIVYLLRHDKRYMIIGSKDKDDE